MNLIATDEYAVVASSVSVLCLALDITYIYKYQGNVG